MVHRISAAFESRRDAVQAVERLLGSGISDARMQDAPLGVTTSGAPGFTGPHQRIIVLATVHPRRMQDVDNILRASGMLEPLEHRSAIRYSLGG
jgi:hypothetical protein